MNKYQYRRTNTTKRMNDPSHHEFGRRRILRLGTNCFPKPISPEKTFIHPETNKIKISYKMVISREWYRRKVFWKSLWDDIHSYSMKLCWVLFWRKSWHRCERLLKQWKEDITFCWLTLCLYLVFFLTKRVYLGRCRQTSSVENQTINEWDCQTFQ